MRKNNRELIEMIRKMEKAGEWEVVCYLLELIQRRSRASRKSLSGAVSTEKVVA